MTKIQSMSIVGGKLDGQTVTFSNEMSCLIGIRGAGKSSILESLRYALNIPLGHEARDRKYKEELVKVFLGSGGKVSVKLADDQGHEYLVERVLGESPVVFRDGIRERELSPQSILNAIYFGQKDLSAVGEAGFGQDLIEKFFEQNTNPFRHRLVDLEIAVEETAQQIKKLEARVMQKEALREERADLEYKLRVFRELKLDEKLSAQSEYVREKNLLSNLVRTETDAWQKLADLNAKNAITRAALSNLSSKSNPEVFEHVNKLHCTLQRYEEDVRQITQGAEQVLVELRDVQTRFDLIGEQLYQQFAEVRRSLQSDNIQADDYLRYQTRLDEVNREKRDVDEAGIELNNLKAKLLRLLEELREVRYEEFCAVNEAVQSLNAKKLSLSVLPKYQGEKQTFYAFLDSLLSGCNIQKTHIKRLAWEYDSPVEMYADLYREPSLLSDILSGGGQLARFRSRIEERLDVFLPYQVPTSYTLLYKGKELAGHSIGQRASALMMFVITKGDHDVILIDQPEDDLDNQTIYQDVVREIIAAQKRTQFIFATHNPNIPVLGDCQQVIRCDYADDRVNLLTGAVTDKLVRSEIVNIMEGGQDAFDRRRNVYKTWGWFS